MLLYNGRNNDEEGTMDDRGKRSDYTLCGNLVVSNFRPKAFLSGYKNIKYYN